LTPQQPVKISLLVYDFDGTLVDTLDDIAGSVNRTLKELGLRTLSRDAVRACVGRGVVELMTRALKETGYTDIEKSVDLFREHYSRHLVEHTDFYPHCREILEHFSGKTQAIFSNKPEEFVRQILQRLNATAPFQHILGGDSLKNKKPDPQGLHLLMEKFNVPAEEVLMIGDTAVDIEAGRAAGVHTCAVSYGLGDPEALRNSRPHYSIDSMADLKLLLI